MSETKAALITGGATRLGRYFATLLASEGYHIALHFNSSSFEATQVVDAIRARGRQCEAFACDFRHGDVEGLVRKAYDRFPGLCILVNSASAYAPANIIDTDRALLQDQFAVNLIAPFLLSKSFVRTVGVGNIVNILDNKVAFYQHAYAAYLLSKKSFAEFTRMAAIEFAPSVRVNAIAPGVILPARTRSNDYLEWRRQGIPLARQGTLAELGEALRYILHNRFVTGQTLVVDGGESINLIGRHSENYSGEISN